MKSKENGLSKGFGFVKLSTKDGYIAATSKEQHILEGNVVRGNSLIINYNTCFCRKTKKIQYRL